MRRVIFLIGLLFLSGSIFAESKDTLIDFFQTDNVRVSFYKSEDNNEVSYPVVVNKLFNEKYCETVTFCVIEKEEGKILYAEACKFSDSSDLYEHMKEIADDSYDLCNTFTEIEDGVSYIVYLYIPL